MGSLRYNAAPLGRPVRILDDESRVYGAAGKTVRVNVLMARIARNVKPDVAQNRIGQIAILAA
jgi:hypothetical protein